MSEIKTRTLKLQPIKVKYTDGNRIPFAAVPKRKATTREAMYILRNIFGFDLDLSLDDCESREEMDEQRKEFTDALNGFLNGGDWCCLCESCYCYDDMDEVNFACFLWLVEYCQKVGIL
jgi:hypothetical protein